jgi:DNA polymerase
MKYTQIVTLDFETYFSKTYSLKSKVLNTSEYIRHSEFKAQCVGIKLGDEPVSWYRDRHVDSAIRSIDWSTTALLCHHTAFDGLILSHHYGVVPAYYLDTLSMARALHSNSIGAGLDEVAKYYKIGNKLPNVLTKTKNVRDLPDDLMVSLGQYCAVDVELCHILYTKMIENFPDKELDLIDMTTRMFCEPILEIDIPRVEKALLREQKIKERKIFVSGVPMEVLSSSEKFAAALTDSGLAVIPTKISPATNKLTYAFSKTDLDFIELGNSPDKKIRRLVAGRLAAKSTIGESRAIRFLEAGAEKKKLPVYLRYFGAHTGRWSGGNKMNLQNLKRGGELRKSIMAPEGHVIVVADSSQIEVRVNAWLAGDLELLELFKTGVDPYIVMASQIYSTPFENITKQQRFVGKVAVLGLGYGMGWKKFKNTLETGAMGPPVSLDDSVCNRAVRVYRKNRSCIVDLWKKMDGVLYGLVNKRKGSLGPLTYDDTCKIWLPNGLYLEYPFITASYDDHTEELTDYRYYDYEDGVRRLLGIRVDEKKAHRIYGGLLTENVVQALARIIVSDQMLTIGTKLKERGDLVSGPPYRRIVTMTHDEIVACVPEDEAEQTLSMMIDVMSTPPNWCSDLPLGAEGGFDRVYSK